MRLLAALVRRSPATPSPAAEPILVAPARPLALPAPAPQPVARPRHDLRHISPRRFAEIAHELYLEGALKWAEYQWVGFPSELHPSYERTIGALTGEKAEPDRPRDMLGEVEGRLDFVRRFRDPDVRHAERAVEILRRQAEPALLS